LSWDEMEGAVAFQIYKNGKPEKRVGDYSYELNNVQFAEYTITAIDVNGFESFAAEPVRVYPQNAKQIIEVEDYAARTALPYVNFSGTGFVKTTPQLNQNIGLTVEVSEAGQYLFDVRYSNGTGPWNTDNNCAIRSLYVNEIYNGVLVLPQRGTDEWSDWGYSNPVRVNLKKGKNLFCIKYDDWNTNMDVKINEALLDYLRLIKME